MALHSAQRYQTYLTPRRYIQFTYSMVLDPEMSFSKSFQNWFSFNTESIFSQADNDLNETEVTGTQQKQVKLSCVLIFWIKSHPNRSSHWGKALLFWIKVLSFGSNLIQTGRANGAERAAGGASLCPSIHPLCSPKAPGSEDCRNCHDSGCNAGTLCLTGVPNVHPRPQVWKPVLQIIMKLIIIIMVLRVMPVLYPLLYSLKPSVHHHLT